MIMEIAQLSAEHGPWIGLLGVIACGLALALRAVWRKLATLLDDMDLEVMMWFSKRPKP